MGAEMSCRSCSQGACVSSRCTSISPVVIWKRDATISSGSSLSLETTRTVFLDCPVLGSTFPALPEHLPLTGTSTEWLACLQSKRLSKPTWCSSD